MFQLCPLSVYFVPFYGVTPVRACAMLVEEERET